MGLRFICLAQGELWYVLVPCAVCIGSEGLCSVPVLSDAMQSIQRLPTDITLHLWMDELAQGMTTTCRELLQ